MSLCKYCKNTFNSVYSLKTHQKKAKYCLKIQDQIKTKKHHKTNNEELEKLRYKIKTLQHEIENLEYENTTLKAKLEMSEKHFNTIVKQPKTINNNQKNNCININLLKPLNLSEKRISAILREKFDKNYFIDGQKGLARCASDHILKDDDGNPIYICTDTSRNVFKFKSEEGNIIKDNEAVRLTKSLINGAAIEIAREIRDNFNFDPVKEEVKFDYTCNQFNDIKNMSEDNKIFRKSL